MGGAGWGQLIDALRLVAAEPDQQVDALLELRAIAAQIRRGEPAPPLLDPSLARAGAVPPEVGSLIERIDQLFDQLVARPPEQAFSEDALASAREWQLMRAMAREALEKLGVSRGPRPVR